MLKARRARGGADAQAIAHDDSYILRWTRDVVAQVAGFEPAMQALSDAELAAQTATLRARHESGEDLDALLAAAFATVREAAVRALGQRPFDAQVMGGAALHLGKVVEMRTGEGKTLAATMPAYLHSLAGDGVHVLTANEYLAGRDAAWMTPVYQAPGLQVGLLAGNSVAERKAAYLADVRYGVANEFCYDYLRDHLAWEVGERVQRGLRYAVVDEADLIIEHVSKQLEFDVVLSDQRRAIYAERQEVLTTADLSDRMKALAAELAGAVIDKAIDDTGSVDAQGCKEALLRLYPTILSTSVIAKAVADSQSDRDSDALGAMIRADVARAYALREAQIGAATMRSLERAVSLRAIDAHWRDHLGELEALRDGIGLRAIGGRSPIAEYRREADLLLREMRRDLRADSVRTLFSVKAELAPRRTKA